MPKSYHSPWDQEILSDPNLAETIQLKMPPVDPRADLPEYRSFNRWGNADALRKTVVMKGRPSHSLSITGWPLPSAALRRRPGRSHSSCLRWTWTRPATRNCRSLAWRDPPSTGRPRVGYLRAPTTSCPPSPWSPWKSQSLKTCRRPCWLYSLTKPGKTQNNNNKY